MGMRSIEQTDESTQTRTQANEFKTMKPATKLVPPLAAKTSGAAARPGTPGLKTAAQVRAELDRDGISAAQWARANGVDRALVYQILNGTRRGLRGQAHQVAVLLGLKAGRVGIKAEDLVSEQSAALARLNRLAGAAS